MKFLFDRPVTWLRIEGVAVLALSAVAYGYTGAGWMMFLLLLLVPDLSMAGYLAGNRFGAILYNLVHTYTAPALLAGFGLYAGHEIALAGALIWTAHIGMDRMLGYGLKLPTGFRDTHLGPIGGGGHEEAVLQQDPQVAVSAGAD